MEFFPPSHSRGLVTEIPGVRTDSALKPLMLTALVPNLCCRDGGIFTPYRPPSESGRPNGILAANAGAPRYVSLCQESRTAIRGGFSSKERV